MQDQKKEKRKTKHCGTSIPTALHQTVLHRLAWVIFGIVQKSFYHRPTAEVQNNVSSGSEGNAPKLLNALK